MQAKKEQGKGPEVGILEWFRPGEYTEVRQALGDLKTLGISHLRTGISWADWHTAGAEQWYDWLFAEVGREVEILPCFLYTPPSLGEAPKTSSPPKYLKAYADFIDVMITRYGEHFQWVELWNEPNNRIEYDFTLDYSWIKFSKMIDMAAYWAKQKGKKTLLGGMSPIDPNWLQMMAEQGTLEHIDAIGIHGFPHVFDQQWDGWAPKIKQIRDMLKGFHMKKEIWISEAGHSTWQHDQVLQYEEFKKVLGTKVERIYWYSLRDLDPKNATVGGFHLDEREYFFGMKKVDGSKKLLYRLLEKGGLENILSHDHITKEYDPSALGRYILITGGAGFIGTNLADRLLGEGKRVMVYDSLAREGVERNLLWLKKKYGERLIVQIADIRERVLLQRCVEMADAIFHLSAQVAVTQAIVTPVEDFDVNLRASFHLLEAVRKSKHRPPLVFTSTNKVYGSLDHLGMDASPTRYIPMDKTIETLGLDESTPLDFHSPYGCSKGAADQYILDYARSYGIRALVFRMSCVYGPHQFGTEDQGWVAHFLISALNGRGISIYGNGKQVRDILYVGDLVQAFVLALENMEALQGQAYNIGGGPKNSVSLREILVMISEMTGHALEVSHADWRVGDQLYYVSDTSKFSKATGWAPDRSVGDGLETLWKWLVEHRDPKTENPLDLKAIAI